MIRRIKSEYWMEKFWKTVLLCWLVILSLLFWISWGKQKKNPLQNSLSSDPDLTPVYSKYRKGVLSTWAWLWPINNLGENTLFYILLTLNHAMILGKWLTWRTNSFLYIYFLFITLYIFRAHRAHHQERQIVSIQLLVTVILCRWPSCVQVGRRLLPTCTQLGHWHSVTVTRGCIDTICLSWRWARSARNM
jgi:hypothetical protein